MIGIYGKTTQNKVMKKSIILTILINICINVSLIAQIQRDKFALIGTALVDYTNKINHMYTEIMANPTYANNTHAVKIRYDSINKIWNLYIQRFFLRSEIDTLDYDLIYFNGHFFYLIKEGNSFKDYFDKYYFVNQEVIPVINKVIFKDEMKAQYGAGLDYIVTIFNYRISYKGYKVELMKIVPAEKLSKDYWPIKELNSYFTRALTDEASIDKFKDGAERGYIKELRKELKDINKWLPISLAIL